jgi:uncharacterized protein (DUF362 family)
VSDKPKVAIVKGEFPPDAAEIDKMVRQALGLLDGMPAKIKPGSHVVIKPNLFAPYPPPISVDRRVVASMVKYARDAGAGRVTVIEGVSVGTMMKRVRLAMTPCGMARGFKTLEVMQLLGVKRAVEEAGGEVIGVEDAETVEVDIRGGIALHHVNYPKVILDADYFINLPAMKTHTMTMVTLSIKNLQGILDEKGRYFSHRDDLNQHMVDISKIRKPDLALLDGLLGMDGMGAGEAGNPVEMGVILASEDCVALDSIASMCMGIDNPLVVTTTRLAGHDGLGTSNPFMIEVVGRQIHEVKKHFELPLTYTMPIDSLVTGIYPNIDIYIGGACSTCWLMATLATALLAQIPQRVSLIVGVDPKIPPKLNTDLAHTFFLGECALATGGELREIRNAMQLNGLDRFLGGCPPYEQSLVKLEDIMIGMGYLKPEKLVEHAGKNREKFFSYYQKYDPTWQPE